MLGTRFPSNAYYPRQAVIIYRLTGFPFAPDAIIKARLLSCNLVSISFLHISAITVVAFPASAYRRESTILSADVSCFILKLRAFPSSYKLHFGISRYSLIVFSKLSSSCYMYDARYYSAFLFNYISCKEHVKPLCCSKNVVNFPHAVVNAPAATPPRNSFI